MTQRNTLNGFSPNGTYTINPPIKSRPIKYTINKPTIIGNDITVVTQKIADSAIIVFVVCV